MIIIHIESGLGNQMLSYCEYLSLKYANPDQKFYLETIIYEIPECNDVICQWNGYELNRIFGINYPENIKSLFSIEEWNIIIQEIRETEFWKHNWNYPVAITTVLKNHGLNLENVRGDFSSSPENQKSNSEIGFIYTLKNSRLGYESRRIYQRIFEDKIVERTNFKDKLFCNYKNDVFTGQWLRFCYRNNDRHLIENDIKKTFVFPPIDDDKNKKIAGYLSTVNAVAIHVRRGDLTKDVNWCFKYGYYKRAVKIIKSKVKDPVFILFSNPGEGNWCRENTKILGLDLNKDIVHIIDWNIDELSFRDMQLMGLCKHAIITTSSFGWWGAYFIDYSNKITISPLISLDTTYHC